jgi:hypothetical protein
VTIQIDEDKGWLEVFADVTAVGSDDQIEDFRSMVLPWLEQIGTRRDA